MDRDPQLLYGLMPDDMGVVQNLQLYHVTPPVPTASLAEWKDVMDSITARHADSEANHTSDINAILASHRDKRNTDYGKFKRINSSVGSVDSSVGSGSAKSLDTDAGEFGDETNGNDEAER